MVIMDNASFHKSKRIKNLIEYAGCGVIFLPPYSPDFNPIEKFWAFMKRWVKVKNPIIPNMYETISEFFRTQTSN